MFSATVEQMASAACVRVPADTPVRFRLTSADVVHGFLASGGSRAEVIATLGHLLLSEDADFHAYQHYEAMARQAKAWPEGSEEAAQVLGVSTPTAKRYWAYARAWLFQEIERLR